MLVDSMFLSLGSKALVLNGSKRLSLITNGSFVTADDGFDLNCVESFIMPSANVDDEVVAELSLSMDDSESDSIKLLRLNSIAEFTFLLPSSGFDFNFLPNSEIDDTFLHLFVSFFF